jgi:hypothetical protein
MRKRHTGRKTNHQENDRFKGKSPRRKYRAEQDWDGVN